MVQDWIGWCILLLLPCLLLRRLKDLSSTRWWPTLACAVTPLVILGLFPCRDPRYVYPSVAAFLVITAGLVERCGWLRPGKGKVWLTAVLALLLLAYFAAFSPWTTPPEALHGRFKLAPEGWYERTFFLAADPRPHWPRRRDGREQVIDKTLALVGRECGELFPSGGQDPYYWVVAGLYLRCQKELDGSPRRRRIPRVFGVCDPRTPTADCRSLFMLSPPAGAHKGRFTSVPLRTTLGTVYLWRRRS